MDKMEMGTYMTQSLIAASFIRLSGTIRQIWNSNFFPAAVTPQHHLIQNDQERKKK